MRLSCVVGMPSEIGSEIPRAYVVLRQCEHIAKDLVKGTMASYAARVAHKS